MNFTTKMDQMPLLTVASALLFIALFTGCKENIVMNADAIDQTDQIDINALPDTLTVFTKTVFEDTLITSANKNPTGAQIEGIGQINDYMLTGMGKTNAHAYIQFAAPVTSYVLDTGVYKFDSIVMILPYSGFTYGDTTATAHDLNYSVYRLQDNLETDSTYFSNHPFLNVMPQLMGTATVPIKKLSELYRDSITVLGKKYPYHLRIKMASSLLDTLIAKTNTNVSTTQPDFVDWLRGFYIKADTMDAANNSIPYWLLNGEANNYRTAALELYYHTKNGNDTLRQTFPYSTTFCTHFNKIQRYYSIGTLASNLLNSMQRSDSLMFVQNLPGGSLDIKMPYVKNLPKGNIMKAELIITEDPSNFNAKWQTPNRIYPYVMNAQKEKLIIADRLPATSDGGLNFIDGNRTLTIHNGTVLSQYVINFPRELQRAIVEQRDTLHLRINGTTTFPAAYRLVAAGRNYSDSKVRLRLNIVYSQLN